MTTCQRCGDTGRDLLEDPCTCPARPFDDTTDTRGPDQQARAAAMVRPPVANVVAFEREIWELAGAIDDALRWSSETLWELANLGTWRQWLGLDGDPAMAAAHVLTCCVSLEGQATTMAAIVERLSAAAGAVQQPDR